ALSASTASTPPSRSSHHTGSAASAASRAVAPSTNSSTTGSRRRRVWPSRPAGRWPSDSAAQVRSSAGSTDITTRPRSKRSTTAAAPTIAANANTSTGSVRDERLDSDFGMQAGEVRGKLDVHADLTEVLTDDFDVFAGQAFAGLEVDLHHQAQRTEPIADRG